MVCFYGLKNGVIVRLFTVSLLRTHSLSSPGILFTKLIISNISYVVVVVALDS